MNFILHSKSINQQVYNMGHQSYILFVSSEEDKQHILDAIQAHNTYRLPTKEEINDPNFEYEVEEELEQIVYTKLLKSKPKMYANYTHAILFGNGGGRSSTFAWFLKTKLIVVHTIEAVANGFLKKGHV